MQEIKNKRITRDVIEKIAYCIQNRYLKLYKLYQIYEKESENYNNPINEQVKSIVVNGKPKFEIAITIEGQTQTRENDIAWLCEHLEKDAKRIEKVVISFLSFYARNTSNNDYFKGTRSQEDVYITFKSDYVSLSFDYQNQSSEYDIMISEIESLFNNCPASYDKTISGKSARKFLPSLSTGLILGLIIGIGLYAVCLFGVNIYINSIIEANYFVPLMFIISLLLACVVPGNNHQLYRDLKIKQKYSGYSMSKNTALYRDDVGSIKNGVEVEIENNYRNGKIRSEIEKNYKKAKIINVILVCLFVIFFIFTIR